MKRETAYAGDDTLNDLVVIPDSACVQTRIKSVEITITDSGGALVGYDRDNSEVSRLSYRIPSTTGHELEFTIEAETEISGNGSLEVVSDYQERIKGVIDGENYSLYFSEQETDIQVELAPSLKVPSFMALLEWAEVIKLVMEHVDVVNSLAGVEPTVAARKRCAGLFFASIGFGLACGLSLGICRGCCLFAAFLWRAWRGCRKAS
jgi:hypothetical protein